MVGSTGENEKDYLYYNGNVNKSVPTTGKADYVGDVIITGGKHPAFEQYDYLTEKSSFSVDFGAKKAIK